MKFFEAIANMFRIPDLRKRVLFTLALLAVYRLGGHIPTPGIDANRLAEFFQQNQGTLFGFIDLFSGGMFRRLTIFALGIMPYITASIILQLLTVVVPTLEKLQKEGELGRRKITQWTRYLTVILARGAILRYRADAAEIAAAASSSNPGFGFMLMTILTLDRRHRVHHVAGRADHRARHRQRHVAADLRRHRGRPAARHREIYDHVFKVARLDADPPDHHPGHDDRGGRLHRAGGARRAPHSGAIRQAHPGPPNDGRPVHPPAAESERGRRDPGDLRVLAAGLPADAHAIGTFVKNSPFLSSMLDSIGGNQPLYYLLFCVLIIFFCFFYVSIIFNPNEAADNMRKYGGFIPGIRPGKNTADYMNKILTKITVVGGLYLSVLSLIPQIMIAGHQAAAAAAGRQLYRHVFPALAAGRLERELLLRRHVAADRGGRRDGYRQPGGSAIDHAALRRLHAAFRPDSGPPQQRVLNA